MGELVIRSNQDIVDFVNRSTGNRRTTVFAVLGLSSVFTDAYDLSSLGIGISQLKSQWHLTSFQVGTVSSIAAIGALVSTLLGGYLADRTGRYRIFMIATAILVVTPVGAALAPNYAVLLVFRFLMGVGAGLDLPVAFSLMVEFLNRRRKAAWVNLWQPLSSVAVMSGGLVALATEYSGAGAHLWRWSVGLGALPVSVILLARLVYAEESPMWAAQHRGLEEAGRIIQRVFAVPVRVVERDDPCQGDAAGGPGPGGTRHTPPKPPRPRVADIFTRRFRARTVLTSVIAGTQSMQYYAIGFYLPVIAGLLFGGNLNDIVLATVVVHTFALVAGILQGALTNRLGLWRLATIGYVIVAACLLVLGARRGAGWNSAPLVAVLLVGILMFGHSFGPGPQSKTMASLSFPTEYRAVGSGWAETMGRVGSILGLFLFPIMLDAFGQANTMLVLALAPLSALVTLLSIRWEPIGQDIETVDVPDEPKAQESSVPAS